MPDVDDLETGLFDIGLLAAPPLPADVVEQLGTLYPYGAVVRVALAAPVGVHLAIVPVLQRRHVAQLRPMQVHFSFLSWPGSGLVLRQV